MWLKKNSALTDNTLEAVSKMVTSWAGGEITLQVHDNEPPQSSYLTTPRLHFNIIQFPPKPAHSALGQVKSRGILNLLCVPDSRAPGHPVPLQPLFWTLNKMTQIHIPPSQSFTHPGQLLTLYIVPGYGVWQHVPLLVLVLVFLIDDGGWKIKSWVNWVGCVVFVKRFKRRGWG